MCIRDRCSTDFLRALHLLNPCPCSSVAQLLYLLEVLTGDNRLVRIGKNNPFLAVDMLIFDALVDSVQRPSENGISCLLYTSSFLISESVLRVNFRFIMFSYLVCSKFISISCCLFIQILINFLFTRDVYKRQVFVLFPFILLFLLLRL